MTAVFGMDEMANLDAQTITMTDDLVGSAPDVVASPPRASALTWHSGLPMRWSSSGPDATVRGTAAEFAAKRAFDIIVSGLALVMLTPLLIVVAVLIKAGSRGPVFFRQQREGLGGKSFWALKFRSMRIEDCDLSGVAQTQQDDPRVTGIGRFIRKTSIDELPQLLNILRGDMSLVGPRPHVRGMQAGGQDYRRLVPYYDLRLSVRPGLTGWAQANGLRGPTTSPRLARERVDHDIAYIQNFSLWLDVRVLCKTVVNEFITGSGH